MRLTYNNMQSLMMTQKSLMRSRTNNHLRRISHHAFVRGRGRNNIQSSNVNFSRSLYNTRSSAAGDDEKDTQSHNSEDDESRRNAFLTTVRHSLVDDIIPLVQGEGKSNHDDDDYEKTRMVVGVSGGCDSISLLHALHQLALPQLELHAVHFDHHLRGVESDGDRDFVDQLCCELKIPLHIYHWETSSSSSSSSANNNNIIGSFTQDRARAWRRKTMYDLLLSLIPKNSGKQQQQQKGILATAHHKDDSVETLMLKLLRGVHISNLTGMEIVSSPQDQPNAVSARPLLKVTKADITHFLTSQSLTWREDSSNTSSKYKRNRIRNELLPLMADIVGSEELLEKRLENLSQQSREMSRNILFWAQRYLDESGSSHNFFLLPSEEEEITSIHREALHLWCRRGQEGITLSYDQLQRIFAQLQNYPKNLEWTLEIRDGWDVVRKGPALQLMKKEDCAKNNQDSAEARELVAWSTVEKTEKEELKTTIIIVSSSFKLPNSPIIIIITRVHQEAKLVDPSSHLPGELIEPPSS